MEKATRVTVSLPEDLLKAVDEKLVNGHQSRSAVVRRLLARAVREAEEREDVQQWIRAYREQPQTDDELGWVDVVGPQFLAEQPWE